MVLTSTGCIHRPDPNTRTVTWNNVVLYRCRDCGKRFSEGGRR